MLYSPKQCTVIDCSLRVTLYADRIFICPFFSWVAAYSKVDSVWQYCFAIIRCLTMNGIDPLLTTFVSYCMAEGRRVKVAVWFSFSSAWPQLLCPIALGMSRLATLLLDASKSGFVYLPFSDAHKIVLGPPSCKRYLRPEPPVHKCNAIWLRPTFVQLVQMTKLTRTLYSWSTAAGTQKPFKNLGGIFSWPFEHALSIAYRAGERKKQQIFSG